MCQATGEPKPRITWMKKGKKVSSQRFEVRPRGRRGRPGSGSSCFGVWSCVRSLGLSPRGVLEAEDGWLRASCDQVSVLRQVIEFDDGAGSVLRIQPLRAQRDEAIYECTATNSLGEINTSAKLSVLEGRYRGGTRQVGGQTGVWAEPASLPCPRQCVFGRRENWPFWA